LDIGTGSGWQAALLARLVGEQGKVIAVERIPELFMFAGKNISGYGFIDKGMVKLVNADGSKGYPAEAPFDKIIAAAAAARVPNAWKEQLRIGGRIVAPVRDSIVVLDKKGPNEFEERRHFGFSFVPLVTD
jgi:protein-L-isoaspartate(D-aspartate) O-methyltransferase